MGIGETRRLSVTQAHTWMPFENSRTPINDKAFGADFNVHYPCHLPSPGMFGAHQGCDHGLHAHLSHRLNPSDKCVVATDVERLHCMSGLKVGFPLYLDINV